MSKEIFKELSKEQIEILKDLIFKYEKSKSDLELLLKFLGLSLGDSFEIVESENKCGIKILKIKGKKLLLEK